MCNLRTILLSSSYLQGVLNKQLYLYFYHVFRVKCAWVGVCVRVFYPAIIGQSWVWHKELWIQKPNLIIVVFHDKGVTIQNISIIKNGFVLTWIDICRAVAFIAFTCSPVVCSSRQSSNSSCHSSIKWYFCCSCLCFQVVSQLFLLHIRWRNPLPVSPLSSAMPKQFSHSRAFYCPLFCLLFIQLTSFLKL